MTAQQPEQPTPDEALAAYEIALTALVVAAVAETGAIWDRLVPGLVEETPPRVRRLLASLLARSWGAHVVRARSIAAITSYRITGRIPEALTDPDLPRLYAAAETLIDRAEAMGVGAVDADPRPSYDGPTLADELAQVAEQHTREALDVLAAEEADRLERLRADAADRAEDDAVARADAEAEAQAEAAAERRERLDDARADLRAEKEAQRADREANREILAEDARQRRREAEERAAARREARVERRRAQRARAVNLARSEAAAAAADELPRALSRTSEYVGWVRRLNDGACERCRGWWMSGGEPRGASPVRPWSVRMKRHNGCLCVQQPVTREEANARGFESGPEPTLRNRPTRDAERAAAT